METVEEIEGILLLSSIIVLMLKSSVERRMSACVNSSKRWGRKTSGASNNAEYVNSANTYFPSLRATKLPKFKSENLSNDLINDLKFFNSFDRRFLL